MNEKQQENKRVMIGRKSVATIPHITYSEVEEINNKLLTPSRQGGNNGTPVVYDEIALLQGKEKYLKEIKARQIFLGLYPTRANKKDKICNGQFSYIIINKKLYNLILRPNYENKSKIQCLKIVVFSKLFDLLFTLGVKDNLEELEQYNGENLGEKFENYAKYHFDYNSKNLTKKQVVKDLRSPFDKCELYSNNTPFEVKSCLGSVGATTLQQTYKVR